MSWLARFARFWYDFIVGDDWTIAVAVVAGIGATAALAHRGRNPWWLLPGAVAAILAVSLWRAARAHDRPTSAE